MTRCSYLGPPYNPSNHPSDEMIRPSPQSQQGFSWWNRFPAAGPPMEMNLSILLQRPVPLPSTETVASEKFYLFNAQQRGHQGPWLFTSPTCLLAFQLVEGAGLPQPLRRNYIILEFPLLVLWVPIIFYHIYDFAYHNASIHIDLLRTTTSSPTYLKHFRRWAGR